MKNKNSFTITAEQAGMRLDVFLAEILSLSRSQAQKLVDDNRVTVNGKEPKKAGDVLKDGYEVKIRATKRKIKPAETVTGATPEEIEKINLVPQVIAETPDYIVINKPSGLLTHPTMAGEKESVAAWVKKAYPEVKKVGDDPSVRPGIVHRLDKEASGLMVIARTQKMFNALKEQFKNRTVNKEYLALVHDPVERNWGEINFPLARSENADRMAARPVKTTVEAIAEGEKEAKTEFIEEKKFVNFSLLRVIIHTGRMHQIRAHMFAYNHPLVGDPLYIQKKRKRAWDDKLGRLFLHSTKLAFTDLSNAVQTFESPLPPELENFLTQLAI